MGHRRKKAPLCPTPQKTKYKNPRAAGNALAAVSYRADVSDMHVYPCRCGYYHTGHKEKYRKFIERQTKRHQTKTPP